MILIDALTSYSHVCLLSPLEIIGTTTNFETEFFRTQKDKCDQICKRFEEHGTKIYGNKSITKFKFSTIFATDF